MHSLSSRAPKWRVSAVGAAVAVAAGALALGPASVAGATPASSGTGNADAVILKTGLNVSLANKAAQVPLQVSLNEVHAPANADKSLLSAKLDGVDGGKPFNVLRADVAKAKATSDARKSEGYANIVNASVLVPGLLGVIQVDGVTSRATCAAGEAPTAGTNFVGDVNVLGKRVSVRAGGTSKVKIAGVGEVSLDMAKTVKTSTTAASTALELKIDVNPGKLNVAEVTGDLTLAKASCQTPGGGDSGGSSSGGSSSGGSSSGGSSDGGTSGGSTSGGSSGSGGGTQPQGGSGHDLAETGGSSATPYIGGAAAVLVVAGGGAVYLSRRKKAQA